MTHIGFVNRRAIDKEFPIAEFDGFTRQGDYPLQKHHLVSGKTHGDNVESPGMGTNIPQPP